LTDFKGCVSIDAGIANHSFFVSDLRESGCKVTEKFSHGIRLRCFFMPATVFFVFMRLFGVKM